MPARLILNADDFGLTPGINRAIVDLHGAGIVTSATLMATAPAFREAVELARAHPALGVGCHLTFVDGIPAAHPEEIPSLLGADGKTFRPSLLDFTQAVLRGTVRASDVARETQAQIQHLQRAGIDVTHVDTHKHVHVHAQIAEPMLHIATRCGVHAVRKPFEPAWSSTLARAPRARRLQMRALDLLRSRFEHMPALRKGEVLSPHGTLGIAATGTLTIETLQAMLAALPAEGVYELCCHPGFFDGALESTATRLKMAREVERAALTLFAANFTHNDTNKGSGDLPELIHYGNLGIAGQQRASGQFQPHDGYEKVL